MLASISFRHSAPIRFAACALLCVLFLSLTACGTRRNAFPEVFQKPIVVSDHGRIRFYGDTVLPDMERAVQEWREAAENGVQTPEVTFLSLSGGGADGAFGAGFLKGWTQRGDRPLFNMVTGVSTGALIAPFAFLGPAYDPVIEKLYTTFATRNLLTYRPIGTALLGDSFFNPAPMRQAMKEYMNHGVIRAIAREHRMGRRLIIGTTDLDAMRPVYWDIGAIAQLSTKEADQLIRDVMLASVSVPMVFPPVYFTARKGGELVQEMHVDGGVTNQVFSYPVSIRLREAMELMGDTRVVRLYVIRNDKLVSRPKVVDPDLADIAMRSISSLIRSQGIGDIYRMYYAAQRDGVDFHLAYIPPHFDLESEELFDPVYMTQLFELGRASALSADPWHTLPPVDLSGDLKDGVMQDGAKKEGEPQ